MNYISLFSGVTGTVYINDNGDRIADYALLDMDPEDGKFKVGSLPSRLHPSLKCSFAPEDKMAFNFLSRQKCLGLRTQPVFPCPERFLFFYFQDVAVYHGLNKSFEMKPGRKIHWPNRDKPPFDKPECGFDGRLCDEGRKPYHQHIRINPLKLHLDL